MSMPVGSDFARNLYDENLPQGVTMFTNWTKEEKEGLTWLIIDTGLVLMIIGSFLKIFNIVAH